MSAQKRLPAVGPGSELPPVGSGPELLRAAIVSAGITQDAAARDIFGVKPSSLSVWLSRKTRPRAEHRETAELWAQIPRSAWDTPAERARRERMMGINTANETAPATPPIGSPKKKKRAPRSAKRRPTQRPAAA